MQKQILTTEELLAVMQENGVLPLTVTGWSMRPLLRQEIDTVWLCPFCCDTCKKGSILLYKRTNGHLVLHRVRHCLPDGYCMNGDAQVACETISTGQVVAQAYRIDRGQKRFSCTALPLRLWDALWYPTRPIRPALLQMGHRLKLMLIKVENAPKKP